MANREEDVLARYAAQYIGATLGVRVEKWDTRHRQGAHDLRYQAGGRTVAVEVKSVVDAGFRQMGAEIDRQEYQPCERLTRFWIISVRHGAMIRDLRAQLPGLLVLLEDVGYEGRPLWMLRQKLPTVAEWLDELGVRALHPTPPTAVHPGGFLLLPEPWGTLFDAILADAGIAVMLSGVRMPRMSSIMERWVQTCRHELLDRTLISNQRHLLRALREFEQFHNGHRPHQGTASARPLRPLPAPMADRDNLARLDIRRGDRLSGILHEYEHAA